jgi:hypothetical protein
LFSELTAMGLLRAAGCCWVLLGAAEGCREECWWDKISANSKDQRLVAPYRTVVLYVIVDSPSPLGGRNQGLYMRNSRGRRECG